MKASTRTGACPLCKRDGQVLQNSHYHPAAVYRVLREETKANPNPLKLTKRGVLQDSLQVTDYLLCWDCEQRFNKNGENWFLAHCWRRGEFRLASILDSATPQPTGPATQTLIYHAARILGPGLNALPYFAASMFWRASAHRWQGTKGIALGLYEEQFRRYLMGEAQFPSGCALLVYVPPNEPLLAGLVLSPYGGRREQYHLWKLPVLGVTFHLLVGTQTPPALRARCFVRGQGNPIHRTDLAEKCTMDDLKLMFGKYPRLLQGPKGHAS